jgi:hypothetical protein
MLFANSIEFFIPATKSAFNSLKLCITHYDKALGAKLNLQKSIRTSIAMTDALEWITNTGCEIAKEGEIYKYLGAPFGVNLTTIAVQNFCLNKLAKRIIMLKPKCISFTRRVQLIKQVVLAMRVYHMM